MKLLKVIIETSEGSAMKYKYDSEKHLFELSKILPAGIVFPYGANGHNYFVQELPHFLQPG